MSLEPLPNHPEPLRVGVVYWTPDDGLVRSYMNGLTELGYTPVPFFYREALPPDLAVVLAAGPYGSLTPVARQLLALDPARRPALAFLLTEQLPDPRLPEPLRRLGGALRSWVDRQAFRPSPRPSDPAGMWEMLPWLEGLSRRGMRYRYYGDLFWLRQAGLLSVLAVWSRWTGDYLARRGFDPLVLRGGANPDWGELLDLERDIPVLWLGKLGSARRGRLLQRLRAELAQRGVELWVVDGVERPYVWAQERTRLLNRTRILLNLLREPWDDNSLRFGLAAANGALIVSEPLLPHSSFQAGQHLVEAPIERLADTICAYLKDEPERRRIAAQARDHIQAVPRYAWLADLMQAARGRAPEQDCPAPDPADWTAVHLAAPQREL